ncbi:MAG: hypothetical protein ACYDCN_07300 [Bacteroidia bacterium]
MIKIELPKLFRNKASAIAFRMRIIIAIIVVFYMISCTNNSPVIFPEADYSTNIVGNWQGTVGDLKETMTINRDCTFVCQVHPLGFIANTLSQGETGTIYGTWKISSAIITLKITGEKNERLINNAAVSTILSLKDEELVLKSDRGDTSIFNRVVNL